MRSKVDVLTPRQSLALASCASKVAESEQDAYLLEERELEERMRPKPAVGGQPPPPEPAEPLATPDPVRNLGEAQRTFGAHRKRLHQVERRLRGRGGGKGGGGGRGRVKNRAGNK